MKIVSARPVVASLVAALIPIAARAQSTSPRPALGLSEPAFWTSSAVLFDAAVALDHTARDAVPAARSPFADALSSIGNTIGRARYDVPVVLTALVGAHVSRNRRWADATTHIALSYATADLVQAILKPVVHRTRPFDPRAHDSFPSAHVTHVASIVAAAAEEAHSPIATAVAATAVSLVAWQRLYARQHWASDVAAGAILGVGMSRLTAHWLRGAL